MSMEPPVRTDTPLSGASAGGESSSELASLTHRQPQATSSSSSQQLSKAAHDAIFGRAASGGPIVAHEEEDSFHHWEQRVPSHIIPPNNVSSQATVQVAAPTALMIMRRRRSNSIDGQKKDILGMSNNSKGSGGSSQGKLSNGSSSKGSSSSNAGNGKQRSSKSSSKAKKVAAAPHDPNDPLNYNAAIQQQHQQEQAYGNVMPHPPPYNDNLTTMRYNSSLHSTVGGYPMGTPMQQLTHPSGALELIARDRARWEADYYSGYGMDYGYDYGPVDGGYYGGSPTVTGVSGMHDVRDLERMQGLYQPKMQQQQGQPHLQGAPVPSSVHPMSAEINMTPHHARKVYQERDYRTDRVWQEDDHSHTSGAMANGDAPANMSRAERRDTDKVSNREHDKSQASLPPLPRLRTGENVIPAQVQRIPPGVTHPAAPQPPVHQGIPNGRGGRLSTGQSADMASPYFLSYQSANVASPYYQARDYKTDYAWQEDDHTRTSNIADPASFRPNRRNADKATNITENDKSQPLPLPQLRAGENGIPAQVAHEARQGQPQGPHPVPQVVPQGRGGRQSIDEYGILSYQSMPPYYQDPLDRNDPRVNQMDMAQESAAAIYSNGHFVHPRYGLIYPPNPVGSVAPLAPPPSPQLAGVYHQHGPRQGRTWVDPHQQQVHPTTMMPQPRAKTGEDGKTTPKSSSMKVSTRNAEPIKKATPAPASAPSQLPPNPNSKPTKHVSFSHLQIRTYETILGDNPSCSGGPSLGLGWRYDPSHYTATVDEYEAHQARLYGTTPSGAPEECRPEDLVLHRFEREAILLNTGYTRQDLADSVRALNKVKNKRRQTVHNLPVAFLEERVEVVKRSLRRWMWKKERTRFMYDEWKKKDGGKEEGGRDAR